jgi:hypothetical protein
MIGKKFRGLISLDKSDGAMDRPCFWHLELKYAGNLLKNLSSEQRYLCYLAIAKRIGL